MTIVQGPQREHWTAEFVTNPVDEFDKPKPSENFKIL